MKLALILFGPFLRSGQNFVCCQCQCITISCLRPFRIDVAYWHIIPCSHCNLFKAPHGLALYRTHLNHSHWVHSELLTLLDGSWNRRGSRESWSRFHESKKIDTIETQANNNKTFFGYLIQLLNKGPPLQPPPPAQPDCEDKKLGKGGGTGSYWAHRIKMQKMLKRKCFFKLDNAKQLATFQWVTCFKQQVEKLTFYVLENNEKKWKDLAFSCCWDWGWTWDWNRYMKEPWREKVTELFRLPCPHNHSVPPQHLVSLC